MTYLEEKLSFRKYVDQEILLYNNKHSIFDISNSTSPINLAPLNIMNALTENFPPNKIPKVLKSYSTVSFELARVISLRLFIFQSYLAEYDMT